MTDDERASGGRRASREAALHMLYRWEMGRLSVDEAIETYWQSAVVEAPHSQRRYAERLARGTVERQPILDRLIEEASEHWRLSRMSVIDRAILRLAAFELLAEPEVPPRVVLNEALELARQYSGDDAVRFVNGVLDAVRRRIDAGLLAD